MGRLGLANIAQVLVASLRATSEPAAPPPCVHIAAALDRLLARARLCLVRLVSPLQAFLEEEQRRDAWCALPLEAVEVRGGTGVRADLAVSVSGWARRVCAWWLSNGDSPRGWGCLYGSISTVPLPSPRRKT